MYRKKVNKFNFIKIISDETRTDANLTSESYLHECKFDY